MVIELAVISVVAGIGLGLRFKVVILVPAVTFVVIFAITVGIARGDHFWSIIVAMVARLSSWNRDTRRSRMSVPNPRRSQAAQTDI